MERNAYRTHRCGAKNPAERETASIFGLTRSYLSINTVSYLIVEVCFTMWNQAVSRTFWYSANERAHWNRRMETEPEGVDSASRHHVAARHRQYLLDIDFIIM
jgi:hypothetical protein